MVVVVTTVVMVQLKQFKLSETLKKPSISTNNGGVVVITVVGMYN